MSLKKIELQKNVDLKKYSSIKVAGRGESLFLVANLVELKQIMQDLGLSFYLLGAGSNILIKDDLIKTPIIKLSGDFEHINKVDENLIDIGAATRLSVLVRYCLKNDLGGPEALVGIPATLGGLLAMNASSFGVSVFDIVTEVDILDQNTKVKTLKKDEIDFGYRMSSLDKTIILGARLSLEKNNSIKEKISKILNLRLDKQDFNYPSCGCIFKNPKEKPAGFLIESCGLKGLSKGGAMVSNKHANFIVNTGSAKYDDLDYLIRKIKEEVFSKYSIILEEEIKRWS